MSSDDEITSSRRMSWQCEEWLQLHDGFTTNGGFLDVRTEEKLWKSLDDLAMSVVDNGPTNKNNGSLRRHCYYGSAENGNFRNRSLAFSVGNKTVISSRKQALKDFPNRCSIVSVIKINVCHFLNCYSCTFSYY